MRIINGWLDVAKHLPSPNFNSRPHNAPINLLVIHNISLPPKCFGNNYIERFFQNCLPIDEHSYFKTIEGMQVSSHFLIKRTGEIVQFVSCEDRAWHAGKSVFLGEENCNDFSLGVELEGADDINYEPLQYQALIELTRAIQHTYPEICLDRIAGHEHIAPGRKTDPGPAFDWVAYRTRI
jgi:N-acetyl-anhydromuramoyl-L-alanine amidase